MKLLQEDDVKETKSSKTESYVEFDLTLIVSKQASVETIYFKSLIEFLSGIGGLFTALKLIVIISISHITLNQYRRTVFKAIKRIDPAKYKKIENK